MHRAHDTWTCSRSLLVCTVHVSRALLVVVLLMLLLLLLMLLLLPPPLLSPC
jgi:hypothetical protein